MHPIGITNQKGGVGKTTTAINLAAGLAETGRRTLLVDLDPQGNASSGVGLERSELAQTAYEALMGLSPIEGCIYPTKMENLFVLPSDLRLIAAEKELAEEEHQETRLEAALRAIAQRYEYILIDTPPSLGLLTVNVFRAVDNLIIPVQSEYYALEGLSTLTETVRRIQTDVNPRLRILGYLMTMVDTRTNLARQVVAEVLRHFGDQVFRTVIARSVRLSEAPSFGQPILSYDPKSPSAEAHRRLTAEVIARCEASSRADDVSSIAYSHIAPAGPETVPASPQPAQHDKEHNMTGVPHGHEAPPGPGPRS